MSQSVRNKSAEYTKLIIEDRKTYSEYHKDWIEQHDTEHTTKQLENTVDFDEWIHGRVDWIAENFDNLWDQPVLRTAERNKDFQLALGRLSDRDPLVYNLWSHFKNDFKIRVDWSPPDYRRIEDCIIDKTWWNKYTKEERLVNYFEARRDFEMYPGRYVDDISAALPTIEVMECNGARDFGIYDDWNFILEVCRKETSIFDDEKFKEDKAYAAYTVSDEATYALNHFIQKGYIQINEDLREGRPNKYAEQMLECLETLKEDTIVFRGLKMDFDINKPIIDQGFMSTSFAPHVATDFWHEYIVIFLPKGTQVIEPGILNPDEFELILPPTTVLKPVKTIKLIGNEGKILKQFVYTELVTDDILKEQILSTGILH